MINLERVKPGQVYLGKSQRGIDGRWYQPHFIVTNVDTEKGYVVVKNGRGESQVMDPKNLFPIQRTLRFLHQQILDARRRHREANDLLIKIGIGAVKQSPQLAEKLGEHLKKLTEDNPDPFQDPEY